MMTRELAGWCIAVIYGIALAGMIVSWIGMFRAQREIERLYRKRYGKKP